VDPLGSVEVLDAVEAIVAVEQVLERVEGRGSLRLVHPCTLTRGAGSFRVVTVKTV
jgi:hypothetical protein